jgi:hypothetical protein
LVSFSLERKENQACKAMADTYMHVCASGGLNYIRAVTCAIAARHAEHRPYTATFMVSMMNVGLYV